MGNSQWHVMRESNDIKRLTNAYTHKFKLTGIKVVAKRLRGPSSLAKNNSTKVEGIP